jgi:hypothetical protein
MDGSMEKTVKLSLPVLSKLSLEDKRLEFSGAGGQTDFTDWMGKYLDSGHKWREFVTSGGGGQWPCVYGLYHVGNYYYCETLC